MEGEESREERLRKAAEQMLGAITSREATGHFIRAGTEIILGLDTIAQNAPVPDDVKERYVSLRDSFLLMVRDHIDEDLIRQGRRPGEKKLQRIEFD